MENLLFFEKCKVWWLGGYYIQVRNSMNNHLEREYLSEEEKELYEKDIGQKILNDYEFIEWYVRSKGSFQNPENLKVE